MSKLKKAVPYFILSATMIYLLSINAARFGFLVYITPFVVLAIATVYSFRYGYKAFYFLIVLGISLPLVFLFVSIPFAIKNIFLFTAMAFVGSKLGGYIHSKEFWS